MTAAERTYCKTSSDSDQIAQTAAYFSGYYLHNEGEQIDPITRMDRLTHPTEGNLLLNLDLLTTLAEHTAAATRRAVTAARAEGHSWQDIASQLGISKQAAQQRYGPNMHEIVDTYFNG